MKNFKDLNILWNKISNIGIDHLPDPSDYKRLRLINRLAFCGIVAMGFMCTMLLILGVVEGVIATSGFLSVCLFGLYLISIGKSASAVIIISVTLMIIITQASVNTPGVGFEYILLLIVVFGFNVIKSYRHAIFVVLLAGITFATIKYLQGKVGAKHDFSETEQKIQFTLITTIIFGTIFLNAFLSRREQDHYEEKLLEQKKEIEKERDRSEKLLLNILPEETARELKEKGEATAKHYKLVTVLFSDFSGFTSIAEKMSAKELVDELHYCFMNFDLIVEKWNVEKIKTIGDAYMCAGGLPNSNITNPEDVVRAGLLMQKFMKEYKAERIAENKPFFEVRIGIHTGPVVAGIVGIKKFAYDIWGDTVNTASRMESNGVVGRVNTSQSTYNLLMDDPNFTFESRGKIKAKGKGEIEMYFVSNS